MGDLKKIVKHLHCHGILGIRVFKSKAQVFLRIEALIFNGPPPSRALGQPIHVGFGDLQTGNPSKGSLLCPIGFQKFENVERKLSFLGVQIGDFIDPDELFDQAISANGFCVVGVERLEIAEFLIDRWQVTILERDEILPVVFSTPLENWAFGEHSVQQKKDWEAGKGLLQFLRESVEGLRFAVLLFRFFTRVFDELGHHRKGETIRSDQLRFQYHVVIKRSPVMFLG